MPRTCSFCNNTPRLTPLPGVIAPDDHRYFDCPVCQENRVSKNEFGEPEFEIPEEFDIDDEEIIDDIFFTEDDDEDDSEFGED